MKDPGLDGVEDLADQAEEPEVGGPVASGPVAVELGLFGLGEDIEPEAEVLLVGEVARGLKAIAKSLEIPVLAVCQLNREPERRNVPRPHLSDLRDSGEIEQEADVVAFLWTAEERSLAELPMTLTLAKTRDGDTGEARLVFRRPYLTFAETPG